MASARILRSVYRSVVRFSRSPSVLQEERFPRIDPTTLFLPAGARTIENGEELTRLVKQTLRTSPASDANIDQALEALRRLNTLRMEIKRNKIKRNSRATDVPLWREEIEYISEASAIDVDAAADANDTTRQPLPLFILGNSFFPENDTRLQVFESKYRTMMADCASGDDKFGYIYEDIQKGQVANIGTLCKVVFREVLPDGRQKIRVKGLGRFKVRSILKTTPYVLADVDLNYVDDAITTESEDSARQLEMETWCALKYYIRLMQQYAHYRDMRVTPSIAISFTSSVASFVVVVVGRYVAIEGVTRMSR